MHEHRSPKPAIPGSSPGCPASSVRAASSESPATAGFRGALLAHSSSAADRPRSRNRPVRGLLTIANRSHASPLVRPGLLCRPPSSTVHISRSRRDVEPARKSRHRVLHPRRTGATRMGQASHVREGAQQDSRVSPRSLAQESSPAPASARSLPPTSSRALRMSLPSSPKSRSEPEPP